MISNVINDEDVAIEPGQRKKPVSILGDAFCEVQAFHYLLGKRKLGYNALQGFPISPIWFFNQKLLKANQYFAVDANYMYFARFVYKQYHLPLSINFAIYVSTLHLCYYDISQRNNSILELVFLYFFAATISS